MYNKNWKNIIPILVHFLGFKILLLNYLIYFTDKIIYSDLVRQNIYFWFIYPILRKKVGSSWKIFFGHNPVHVFQQRIYLPLVANK